MASCRGANLLDASPHHGATASRLYSRKHLSNTVCGRGCAHRDGVKVVARCQNELRRLKYSESGKCKPLSARKLTSAHPRRSLLSIPLVTGLHCRILSLLLHVAVSMEQCEAVDPRLATSSIKAKKCAAARNRTRDLSIARRRRTSATRYPCATPAN